MDIIDILRENSVDLIVCRLKKHTLLGMNARMREEKKIEIEVKNQFMESSENFGKELPNVDVHNLHHLVYTVIYKYQ